MKDYRLSEIKNHDRNEDWEIGNDNTFMAAIYKSFLSNLQDTLRETPLEARDMVELPCKIPMIAINEQALAYQVVYRSVLGTGEIVTRIFDNETDADVFLSYCKKRNN